MTHDTCKNAVNLQFGRVVLKYRDTDLTLLFNHS